MVERSMVKGSVLPAWRLRLSVLLVGVYLLAVGCEGDRPEGIDGGPRDDGAPDSGNRHDSGSVPDQEDAGPCPDECVDGGNCRMPGEQWLEGASRCLCEEDLEVVCFDDG